MRSTQLQTLRAVAAGATTARIAHILGVPLSAATSRLRRLARDGYTFEFRIDYPTWELTDKARALLETRAQLDGETEPGLGYMQGKGAS